jgi:hypothetical protein
MDINILELIELTKAEGKKYVMLDYHISEEDKLELFEMDICVYYFGKHTVISWSLPKGRTSGKVAVPMILDFITQIARKQNRNIL